MYAIMVERDAIYFDVKVSFVESCENTKEDKKKGGEKKRKKILYEKEINKHK